MRLKKEFATDAPNALPILCVKLSAKDIYELNVDGHLSSHLFTFGDIPMGLDITLEREIEREKKKS